jgi:hypothetical protein
MQNNPSQNVGKKSKKPELSDSVVSEETYFGVEHFALTLERINYSWEKDGKLDLATAILNDSKALAKIDYKGIQAFKERLRDSFRAAGKRGADAYARAVYQELTEGSCKYGVEAYITTSAIPNDPDLKPGEYGVFFFIAKNGDRLKIPF